MAAKSLRELFVEELRDIYDAEKRLVRALPKVAKAVESDELRAAITAHLRETERQVTRVEQVFRAIGETARAKKCEGMVGMIEEADTMIEELETGPVLDAALIAGAQKVEHYEIASYGTLATYADLLGEERAKALLGETLDEEKAADEKLNAIATSDVNREALTGGGEKADEDDESESGTFVGRVMGMANDRGARGRSAGSGNGRGGSRGSSSRSGSRKSSKKR